MGDKKEKLRKDLLVKSVDKLKKKCKAEKVSAEGNKGAMVERIIAKVYDDQSVNDEATDAVENAKEEVQGNDDEKEEEEVENTANGDDEQMKEDEEVAINKEDDQNVENDDQDKTEDENKENVAEV